MNLFDVIRVVLDESVGNGGALDNCRRELDRRYEVDRKVRDLAARIDHATADADVATTAHRHRPAS